MSCKRCEGGMVRSTNEQLGLFADNTSLIPCANCCNHELSLGVHCQRCGLILAEMIQATERNSNHELRR